MKFRWSISTRTILLAWAAVAITAAATLLLQRPIIRSQGIALEENALPNLVLSVQNIRDRVSAMNAAKAFPVSAPG